MTVNLVMRLTLAIIVLFLSNCWFGVYQSAKLLYDGEHSVEPIIETVSGAELKDYYVRGGVRYTLGRERINHQVLVLADLYGVTDAESYDMYTLQYGIKKQVRKDRIASLFEFGVKSDLRLYTNGYFSFSPLFSVSVSEYTTFTVAPSIKLNVINVDHRLAVSPSFGVIFNCETGFAGIKIIPEISAYIYPAGFYMCSGVGIPIRFGTIIPTDVK